MTGKPSSTTMELYDVLHEAANNGATVRLLLITGDVFVGQVDRMNDDWVVIFGTSDDGFPVHIKVRTIIAIQYSRHMSAEPMIGAPQ